jgi:glycosyltransferase involved in cell wall biosynthesis
MRWFRENVGQLFSCLLKTGGTLEGEFAALCPTSTLNTGPWRDGTRKRWVLRKLRMENLGIRLYVQSIMRPQIPRPDLIYCNTTATLPGLELAARGGSKILCHVHELEYCMRAGIGHAASQRVLDLSDRIIACSQAVADNLIERHHVAADRIDVVHEYISVPPAGSHPDGRRWLRDQLGIKPNAFIVGGSGALEWRKGTDLFVQLAALIRRMKPSLDVHFLWLGGDSRSTQGAEFLHDVELCGLKDRVTLVPSQPDPMRYFSGLDLFVLPSREDPYPLVCLEAAACGCPILCFNRAGGMPEFVEDDCGAVAPYLDIQTMASQVLRFLADGELRDRHGRAAQAKVRDRHDVSVAAPKILEIMRRIMTADEPADRALAACP